MFIFLCFASPELDPIQAVGAVVGFSGSGLPFIHQVNRHKMLHVPLKQKNGCLLRFRRRKNVKTNIVNSHGNANGPMTRPFSSSPPPSPQKPSTILFGSVGRVTFTLKKAKGGVRWPKLLDDEQRKPGQAQLYSADSGRGAVATRAGLGVVGLPFGAVSWKSTQLFGRNNLSIV